MMRGGGDFIGVRGESGLSRRLLNGKPQKGIAFLKLKKSSTPQEGKYSKAEKKKGLLSSFKKIALKENINNPHQESDIFVWLFSGLMPMGT